MPPEGPKQPRLSKGKNSFIDPTRARLLDGVTPIGSGSSNRNLHAIVSDLTNASEQEKREVGDAVDRHAFMQRVLEVKGSYFPSYV